MPYNKLLTNFTCLGPYWGILALGGFFTDLAALGPYCHDLGPVRPSRSVSKRLVFCTVTGEGLRQKRFIKFLLFSFFIAKRCPFSTFFLPFIVYHTLRFGLGIFRDPPGAVAPLLARSNAKYKR